jgi:protein ImuA
MQRAVLPLPVVSGVKALAPASVARAVPRAGLWWAGQVADASDGAEASCPTGFAALDAVLPGGGWPGAGLMEWLVEAPGAGSANETAAAALGHGELRLLAPAWAKTGLRQIWVAPPAWPYGPALAALGWDLAQLVVIGAQNGGQNGAQITGLQALQDQAWAAEQALRSRTCGLVLWWCSERTAPAVLRRLHLAALDHGCPLVALRPAAARQQSSPAPLRLALRAVRGGVAVDVFKRRGPPLAQPLVLRWPVALSFQLRADLPSMQSAIHTVVQPAVQPVEAPHALVRPAPAVLAA